MQKKPSTFLGHKLTVDTLILFVALIGMLGSLVGGGITAIYYFVDKQPFFGLAYAAGAYLGFLTSKRFGQLADLGNV